MGKKIAILTLLLVLVIGSIAFAQTKPATKEACTDCKTTCGDAKTAEKGACTDCKTTCSDSKTAGKCNCTTAGKPCICPPGKCTCKDAKMAPSSKCGPGGCPGKGLQPGSHGYKCPMTGHGRMHMMRGFRHRGKNHAIMGSFLLQPGIRERLALTSKQVESLEQLKAQQMKEAIDLNAEIQKMNVDLKIAMKSMDPDLAALESRMKEIAMRKVQLKLHRLKGFQKAKAVLTDKQKTVLAEIWNKPMPHPAPPVDGKKSGGDDLFHMSMVSDEDFELMNVFVIDEMDFPGHGEPEN